MTDRCETDMSAYADITMNESRLRPAIGAAAQDFHSKKMRNLSESQTGTEERRHFIERKIYEVYAGA